MNWLMEYANNASTYMIAPMIVGAVIAAVIGGYSWWERDGEDGAKKPLAFGSMEYANATWRMWASAQIVGIMWIIWILLASVPEPDFSVRTRTVTVEKQVTALSKFEDAYDNCIYRFERVGQVGPRDALRCEQVALAISNPNVKQLTYTRDVPGPVRTVTRTVEKKVEVLPSYERTYEMCSDSFGYPLSKSESRTCHNHALWATGDPNQARFWVNP